MWVIFLASTLIFALAAMCIVWIGSKVYLSIKRDNKKFNSETEKETKEE